MPWNRVTRTVLNTTEERISSEKRNLAEFWRRWLTGEDQLKNHQTTSSYTSNIWRRRTEEHRGDQRSSEEQRGEPRRTEEHTVNISCGQQKQKTNRLIFYCRRRRASGWRRPNAGVLASERPSPKRHRHALRLWPIRWWREEDRRRSWRLKKPSNAGKSERQRNAGADPSEAGPERLRICTQSVSVESRSNGRQNEPG